jgi:drug/metabolite transporter (DMT)-like permease
LTPAAASHAHPADNPRLGILMMVVACGVWALHDAASKWLASDYSVFQILLMRSLFALVPILLLAQRQAGLRALRSRRVRAMLGRGALGVTSFTLFLVALPMMPFADVYAIVMAAPLFITALSSLMLREHVGWRRWAAVLVGFAAVVVMVQPEGGIVPEAAALLIGSVLFYALAMMATRRLGRYERATTMSFYSGLLFLAVGAASAPFVWIAPSFADFALMAATGLLAGVAQYCMTQAFIVAPPATVSPFEYTTMVWAVLLGFLVWHDFPSWIVLGGSVVIVGSGLYVLHRETMRLRAARRASPPAQALDSQVNHTT